MYQSHISLTSLYPVFFRGTIIIEAQTQQILQEVADMIILKILAAPFVVALTLLVAIVSFLYCVASALCHITLLALVLFIGGQTLGGVVFLVLAFLVSPFGIPAIADWLTRL